MKINNPFNTFFMFKDSPPSYKAYYFLLILHKEIHIWNSDEELQQEGRVSLTEKAFG